MTTPVGFRAILTIFFLLSSLSIASAKEPSNVILLNRLDSLISRKNEVEKDKNARIIELKNKRNAAATDEDRYWINNLLYDEYYCYNVDSAMQYINDNMKIAERTGDYNRLTDLKIKKSFLLTASGLLVQAQKELNGIDATALPHQLKKDFYGQKIYIYGILGNYEGLSSDDHGWNHYFETEQNYKDSLINILQPGDSGYLWYRGWSAQGLPREKQDSVMKMLITHVDDTDLLNSREQAQIAYVLAVLYKEQGNHEKYLEYMIKSAIADVRIGNREIASLQELAKSLFSENDIDRAYNYITYCLDAALQYPNRVRALTLLPVQTQISEAYQDKIKRQETITRHFLIALCIISAILAGAIIIIFLQWRRKKLQNLEISKTNDILHKKNGQLDSAREQLASTNLKLQELNEKLKKANDSLREANYVKEEYVGYVFSICSHYIKKMEELRRSINSKIVKKQWDEIGKITSSHQTMAKHELKEFYDNFDSIFLHIYPDFVNDFNKLLLPEEVITVKDGELLTTELRIYALVRLGINDSVKIAEFLHCSPQTVYNYRFKMRAKAAVDKEHFAEAVKNLGKVDLK